jgi:hypothetical protein
MKYVSGSIVKAYIPNLGEKICLITQPYEKLYICGFTFGFLRDIKGNPIDEYRIIYKEVKEENIKEIEIEKLTNEEINDINFLKNNLLIDIRKRKLKKLNLNG